MAAAALSHATGQLFLQRQVHTDHAAGGAVSSIMTQIPASFLLFYSHMVASFTATHLLWKQSTVQQESATSAPSGAAVMSRLQHRCSEEAPSSPRLSPVPWRDRFQPSNKRHMDAICILAKAQSKVVKQLVAGANKDLINTLSECAASILNGNMILLPPQKQRLSRHEDALRALGWQTVSQCAKKAPWSRT